MRRECSGCSSYLTLEKNLSVLSCVTADPLGIVKRRPQPPCRFSLSPACLFLFLSFIFFPCSSVTLTLLALLSLFPPGKRSLILVFLHFTRFPVFILNGEDFLSIPLSNNRHLSCLLLLWVFLPPLLFFPLFSLPVKK